MFAFAVHSVT